MFWALSTIRDYIRADDEEHILRSRQVSSEKCRCNTAVNSSSHLLSFGVSPTVNFWPVSHGMAEWRFHTIYTMGTEADHWSCPVYKRCWGKKKKRRVVQALSLHYTTEPSRHDSFPNLVANGNRSFLLLFGGAGTWLKNDLLSSPLVCIQSDSSVFTVGLNTIWFFCLHCWFEYNLTLPSSSLVWVQSDPNLQKKRKKNSKKKKSSQPPYQSTVILELNQSHKMAWMSEAQQNWSSCKKF